MKIILEYVTVRNFLGYGNVHTKFNLDRKGVTLVHGKNGTGKTSLLIHAPVYALYGKTASNIESADIINTINKKDCEVKLQLRKLNDVYIIHRGRRGGANSFLKLYKNGIDISLDSIANTNKEIEKIIGMSYDACVRILLINTQQSFFDMPPRMRIDIVEELFNLQKLTEKAENLKVSIKDTESCVAIHRQRAQYITKVHDDHQIQLKNIEARITQWNATNERETYEISQKLLSIPDNDSINTQKQFHDKIYNLNQTHTQLINNLKDINHTIKQLLKNQQQIEHEIKHLTDSTCPYCLQKFIPEADVLTNKQNTYNNTLQQIDEQSESLHRLSSQLEDVTKLIKNISEHITIKDIDAILKLRDQLGILTDKLQTLKESINPFNDVLREMKNKKLEQVDTVEYDTHVEMLEHKKFLLKLLTKTDSFIRKTLISQNLRYLNTQLSHYLQLLDLPHQVKFNEDLTADITRYGNNIPWNNLSKGQKARINFALSHAFRNVHMKRHGIINMYALDEVLDDGLDIDGVVASVKMLKNEACDNNISIYVVSHRGEEIQNMFDQRICTSMRDNFSHIEVD